MLSTQEIEYYLQHSQLPLWDTSCQETFKGMRILCIGAGGLSCFALPLFATLGVGHIFIIDNDIISLSNLPRQHLYTHDDIGHLKVTVAKKRLAMLNPFIHIYAIPERFTASNALALVEQVDWVIDGSDNFYTKYLCNDACIIKNKPFVSASVHQYKGQLSIYNYKKGPSYRCLFPSPTSFQSVVSCATSGILHTVVSMVGSLVVNEWIKVVTGSENTLCGQLLQIDVRTLSIEYFSFKRDEDVCSIHSLPLNKTEDINISLITTQELKDNLISIQKKYTIIDLRSPSSFNAINIGGTNIPFDMFNDYIQQISASPPPYLFVCDRGVKSLLASKKIADVYPHLLKNIFSLQGGMIAYINIQ